MQAPKSGQQSGGKFVVARVAGFTGSYIAGWQAGCCVSVAAMATPRSSRVRPVAHLKQPTSRKPRPAHSNSKQLQAWPALINIPPTGWPARPLRFGYFEPPLAAYQNTAARSPFWLASWLAGWPASWLDASKPLGLASIPARLRPEKISQQTRLVNFVALVVCRLGPSGFSLSLSLMNLIVARPASAAAKVAGLAALAWHRAGRCIRDAPGRHGGGRGRQASSPSAGRKPGIRRLAGQYRILLMSCRSGQPNERQHRDRLW